MDLIGSKHLSSGCMQSSRGIIATAVSAADVDDDIQHNFDEKMMHTCEKESKKVRKPLVSPFYLVCS